MKEYRNNSSRLDGFLPIEITNEAQVRPTPMATPIKAQEASAPAINLKPKTRIIGEPEKGSFDGAESIFSLSLFGLLLNAYYSIKENP